MAFDLRQYGGDFDSLVGTPTQHTDAAVTHRCSSVAVKTQQMLNWKRLQFNFGLKFKKRATLRISLALNQIFRVHKASSCLPTDKISCCYLLQVGNRKCLINHLHLHLAPHFLD